MPPPEIRPWPTLRSRFNGRGIKSRPDVEDSSAQDPQRCKAAGRAWGRQSAKAFMPPRIHLAFHVEARQTQDGTYHVKRGNAGQYLMQERPGLPTRTHAHEEKRRRHAKADRITQTVQFTAELTRHARKPSDVTVQGIENHRANDQPTAIGKIKPCGFRAVHFVRQGYRRKTAHGIAQG